MKIFQILEHFEEAEVVRRWSDRQHISMWLVSSSVNGFDRFLFYEDKFHAFLGEQFNRNFPTCRLIIMQPELQSTFTDISNSIRQLISNLLHLFSFIFTCSWARILFLSFIDQRYSSTRLQPTINNNIWNLANTLFKFSPTRTLFWTNPNQASVRFLKLKFLNCG